MDLTNKLTLLGIIVSILIPIFGKIINTISENRKYSKRQNRVSLINIAKKEMEYINHIDEFKKEMQPFYDQYFKVFMYDVYLSNYKLSIPINIGGILEIDRNNYATIKPNEIIDKLDFENLISKNGLNFYYKNLKEIKRRTSEIKEYLNFYNHSECQEYILYDYKYMLNKLIGIFKLIYRNNKLIRNAYKQHLLKLSNIIIIIKKYQDYIEFKEYLEREKLIS